MGCEAGFHMEAAPAAGRLPPVYLFAFKTKIIYNDGLQADRFATFWENINT